MVGPGGKLKRMNAVEIEEAVSRLAEQPFDPEEFPFAFLEAFGNKATTLKRLRTGSTNASDLLGGVLQRNNIHIAVAHPGAVTQTLAALRGYVAAHLSMALPVALNDQYLARTLAKKLRPGSGKPSVSV